MDVNGRLHSLTQYHVVMIIIIGWTSFIMSWIFNIAFYKVHPSAVDFKLKRARARLFIYLFGYKFNLPGYLDNWQTPVLTSEGPHPLRSLESRFVRIDYL